MDEKPKDARPAFPPMKRANKSVGRNFDMIELDVTPVMNLFMVLIPFLVSMAVFTHIAVIDFSLPPARYQGTRHIDRHLDAVAELVRRLQDCGDG